MNILTLSGWAQPADALSALIPGAAAFDYSDYAGPEDAIAALAGYRDVPLVVGWSTGGWLAVQAVAAGALAPKALLLLAAPYQFVNDESFGDGMGPQTFSQFRKNYIDDPERTASRFHGLTAKGDSNTRGVMGRLSHHPDVLNAARWLPWLDALAICNLEDIRLDTPHIRLLHGENDAIVPVAQSAHLAARHPQMMRDLWQNTCHAPHLHDTERFMDNIKAMYADRY